MSNGGTGWHLLFDGLDSPYEMNVDLQPGETILAEGGYPNLEIKETKMLPVERLVVHGVKAVAHFDGISRDVIVSRVVAITPEGEVEVARQALPLDPDTGQAEEANESRCSACGDLIPLGMAVRTNEGYAHPECIEEDEGEDGDGKG